MKEFAKFAKPSTVFPTANAAIGYGCMGITSFYGDAMEEGAAMTLLQTVYDNGCRHFDTAEMYSNPNPEMHNEKVLGRFLQTLGKDHRHTYTIGTKYFPEDGKYDYDTVKRHLMGSLERLQLDYVDLYYAHRVVSLQGGHDFVQTAQKLQQEGLIKQVGLSEVSGKWLKQICEKQPNVVDAIQQEWSILTRSLEDDLIPVCQEYDITVVAYSPLCRNLLVVPPEMEQAVMAPNDFRANLPRYQNLPQNKAFAQTVRQIATKMNCTPAQLCLAWVMQKAVEMNVAVVPIPGTTKIDRAIGNLQATEVQISDPKDMKVLNAMADKVVGERYAENFMGNNMSIERQS